MSEEAAATPAAPEVNEHVSLGENGVIILSPEAEAAMSGVEMPVLEEPAAPDATPAPAEAAVPETPAVRKIKYNGEEVEVPADKEVEYLQKGYNYEQKMQALETQRAKLTAFEGVMSAMEASPAIRQKIAEALGHAQAPPAPEAPPTFDDPIEQLRWEMRQEVLKEVEERFVKPMQQQTQLTAHQAALNTVRQQVQADPQYKEIQAAIVEQIKALPESVGKNLYLQLDQDPQAYTEMFKATKERLKSTSTVTEQLPQSTELPPPTKRETKAPLLETGSNIAPDATEQQRQKEHIRDLEKRSRNGDFKAVGELLELMA